MRRRDSETDGYGTLVVFASIILVSGLFIAWSAPFLYRIAGERAIADQAIAEHRLKKEFLSVLDTLAATSQGNPESMTTEALRNGTELKDLCGFLNPSWISVDFLRSIDATVIIGDESIDTFIARRSAAGPGVILKTSEDLEQEKEQTKILCYDAPLNLNLVDEDSFVAVMDAITDAPGSGLAWLDRLMDRRNSGNWFRKPEDASQFFGPLWPRLRRFITTDAPLNANSIDPLLLECILGSSLFHVKDPVRKRDLILEARKQQFLDQEKIQILIGLPPENPIWLWLGTTTHYWRLEYKSERGLSFIVILRTRWEGEEGGCFEILNRRIMRG